MCVLLFVLRLLCVVAFGFMFACVSLPCCFPFVCLCFLCVWCYLSVCVLNYSVVFFGCLLKCVLCCRCVRCF